MPRRVLPPYVHPPGPGRPQLEGAQRPSSSCTYHSSACTTRSSALSIRTLFRRLRKFCMSFASSMRGSDSKTFHIRHSNTFAFTYFSAFGFQKHSSLRSPTRQSAPRVPQCHPILQPSGFREEDDAFHCPSATSRRSLFRLDARTFLAQYLSSRGASLLLARAASVV
ncbi:hypothetical protein FA95DRAFT_1332955 [Auriscalpium vulgare]|uniref:Uncharacterized protein n=1 Tax=Auriscalpium vulgare TaxID=40419 RepID=A0ACB8S7R3_9AGAM|nr:hypothetical protein FA95DRAFT_1332955 [Auriscalpium vulgare]